jgi:hypothetical protein
MKRLALAALVVLGLVPTAAAIQAQAPAAAAPTELEQLRQQLVTARREANEALDALALARAQRGDCETTLAPIEAQARRQDSAQRWAELKTLMEKAQPGFECDPHSGVCTKKPEEKQAPEKKSGGL